LIRLYRDITASAITGVICLRGTSSCGYTTTSISSALETVKRGGGFGVFLSTLSGLNGNKLQAAYADVVFLFVKALSLAGLYIEAKDSLLIVFVPP
jgi:hypothetical protein